jgi:hypothetical protein
MLRLSWSPDGHWISYDRDNLGGANGVGCCSMSLHLIHPDGSGDHVVIKMREPLQDTPTAPLWAPSGHQFAFTTEASDARDPALALADASSGKITALPVPNANVFPIGWSPDGTELAVMQGGATNSLQLIDASGQTRALATSLSPWLAGAWSRDGLVITGAQTDSNSHIGKADLELIDPAGGQPRVLTNLPLGSQVTIVSWRPHAPTQ